MYRCNNSFGFKSDDSVFVSGRSREESPSQNIFYAKHYIISLLHMYDIVKFTKIKIASTNKISGVAETVYFLSIRLQAKKYIIEISRFLSRRNLVLFLFLLMSMNIIDKFRPYFTELKNINMYNFQLTNIDQSMTSL